MFYSRTNRHLLGYWIEPRELTLKLNSTGLPSLRCPYPVLGLVAVEDGGIDITDSVTFNGHFLFYNGGSFGTLPSSISRTEFATIVVTGKFGDPGDRILRDADLNPTIPWDIKDCVMRIAWHQLRRERVTIHQTTTRDAQHSRTLKADLARDTQVADVIEAWKVVENSGTFDFR